MIADDLRGWADAAEREGRVRSAEVLRRMADNPGLPGVSLSADELRVVVGSPVSLEELEAAAGRLERLAACVSARVREDRRLVAALGAEPGDRVAVDGVVCLVAADRRLIKLERVRPRSLGRPVVKGETL